MDIKSNIISPSDENGKEALLGAAHYRNYPEDFTESVQKSYIVSVRGFKRRDFDENVKKNIFDIKKRSKRTK
jgi:hypothetical protein